MLQQQVGVTTRPQQSSPAIMFLSFLNEQGRILYGGFYINKRSTNIERILYESKVTPSSGANTGDKATTANKYQMYQLITQVLASCCFLVTYCMPALSAGFKVKVKPKAWAKSAVMLLSCFGVTLLHIEVLYSLYITEKICFWIMYLAPLVTNLS